MPTPIKKNYITEKFYFLLPVEVPEIPERISEFAKAEGLNSKSECHVSLVVEKSAKAIRAGLEKFENPEEIKEKILELFNSLSFEYSLTNKYAYMEKVYTREQLDGAGLTEEPEHSRRSIAQVVDMPDMDKFYSEVSTLLGVNLDVPIPHITILAWSDYAPKPTRGIGISSKADFDLYTKKYL